jgi:hypothetical protein
MNQAFCEAYSDVEDMTRKREPRDLDDTSAEDLVEDPYPPRRRFFHVTQFRAAITMFGSVAAALGIFYFIADARMDSRELMERDWIASHFVTSAQEDERIKALDRRLQEIRETQVQIATMIDEMRKQIFDSGRRK